MLRCLIPITARSLHFVSLAKFLTAKGHDCCKRFCTSPLRCVGLPRLTHPTTFQHQPLPCCLPVQLSIIPGAKGMQELLHHIPTWISFRETEKMEVRGRGQQAHGCRCTCRAMGESQLGMLWGCLPLIAAGCEATARNMLALSASHCPPQWLNRVLEKAWPYYDEAICKMVKVRLPAFRLWWRALVEAAHAGVQDLLARRMEAPLPCARPSQAVMHGLLIRCYVALDICMVWHARLFPPTLPAGPGHPNLQEQVEPLMMQYKPPGLIKKIYFQKITFGDDPFRCAPCIVVIRGPGCYGVAVDIQ